MKKLKKEEEMKKWNDLITDKMNTFKNLMNYNEPTEVIHDTLNKTILELCKYKTNLKISISGTKICPYCYEDFQKDGASLLGCKCMSFHKNCLLNVALKISPDLDAFQLQSLKCLLCGKNIPYGFLETALKPEFEKEKIRIEEKKNRKVRCILCKKEEKFDQMFERSCGHNFCKPCFMMHLKDKISKNKGNIRDYVCPGENCQFLKFI